MKTALFDPRIPGDVFSDNPALILGDLIVKGDIKHGWLGRGDFWERIGLLATYCEEIVSGEDKGEGSQSCY